jgi:hypothetical protein
VKDIQCVVQQTETASGKKTAMPGRPAIGESDLEPTTAVRDGMSLFAVCGTMLAFARIARLKPHAL